MHVCVFVFSTDKSIGRQLFLGLPPCLHFVGFTANSGEDSVRDVFTLLVVGRVLFVVRLSRHSATRTRLAVNFATLLGFSCFLSGATQRFSSICIVPGELPCSRHMNGGLETLRIARC